MLLAACARPPQVQMPPYPQFPDDMPMARPASQPDGEAFEWRLRERAAAQMAQGRLADAAVSWETLTVLRPASSEYRDRLLDARRRIAEALPEQLQRAEQARKRGELDAAAAQYLAVLALQPDNGKAMDALRAMEQERNRRNYLNKTARVVQAPRAEGPETARSSARAVSSGLDRNDMEHAAILAGQGEFDDAIALLERHLAAYQGDTGACQLLAVMYSRKAERQLSRDKSAAKALQEKGQRLDCAGRR